MRFNTLLPTRDDTLLTLEAKILTVLSTGVGGTTGATGNYGGAQPNFTPTSTSYAIDTSTGRVWWYYSGQWN